MGTAGFFFEASVGAHVHVRIESRCTDLLKQSLNVSHHLPLFHPVRASRLPTWLVQVHATGIVKETDKKFWSTKVWYALWF